MDHRPAHVLLAVVLGRLLPARPRDEDGGEPPPRPYAIPGRMTTARTPLAASASTCRSIR
ncbi:hypothetical protein [Streptomyces vinaceus]|uniref:hypothetical protein n=1 Tax=Streptomyces vinaceus TaxID=1960 RepID=UPI0036C29758